MTPDDLLCNEVHGRVGDVVRQVQRDLADEHDSQRCDCEMCVAAEEYEARKARDLNDDSDGGSVSWCDDCHGYTHMPWCPQYKAGETEKVSKAVSGAENASTTSCDAGIGLSDRGQGSLWADAATIRAAIADTLDEGWQCSKGCDLRHPWMFPTEMFPGDEEPNANDIELRGRFTDTVLRRLRELQSPPHDYPRLEVLCPTHIRQRLNSHSGWCVECERERRR